VDLAYPILYPILPDYTQYSNPTMPVLFDRGWSLSEPTADILIETLASALKT